MRMTGVHAHTTERLRTRQRQRALELANRAGGSGWAEPTPGQENNRADRAGPDLNRAAISLTQPGPISG